MLRICRKVSRPDTITGTDGRCIPSILPVPPFPSYHHCRNQETSQIRDKLDRGPGCSSDAHYPHVTNSTTIWTKNDKEVENYTKVSGIILLTLKAFDAKMRLNYLNRASSVVLSVLLFRFDLMCIVYCCLPCLPGEQRFSTRLRVRGYSNT